MDYSMYLQYEKDIADKHRKNYHILNCIVFIFCFINYCIHYIIKIILFFLLMTIRKTKGLYEVKVMIHYKNIIVGYFKTETIARDEYNKFIETNKLNRKKMII